MRTIVDGCDPFHNIGDERDVMWLRVILTAKESHRGAISAIQNCKYDCLQNVEHKMFFLVS
jgi:hypothetical protein